jgi:hypothetical protein
VGVVVAGAPILLAVLGGLLVLVGLAAMVRLGRST